MSRLAGDCTSSFGTTNGATFVIVDSDLDSVEKFCIRPYELCDSTAGRVGMVFLSAAAWTFSLFTFPAAVGIHHLIKQLSPEQREALNCAVRLTAKIFVTVAKIALLVTVAVLEAKERNRDHRNHRGHRQA